MKCNKKGVISLALKKARAVFAGGGTRVIALIGAFERVLEEKIFEFEAFAGVSAGSLVAFLASVGRSPKDMLAYVTKKNLMDLVDLYGFPEGMLFRIYHHLKRLSKQGQVSPQLLIRPIVKRMVGKLIERRIKKSNHLLRGKALQEWVESIVRGQRVKYFRDLKKELIIVAFDLVTGEEFIFSRRTTPDAEIAFAITASMSAWPLFPIKEYYNQDCKQIMRLADGGLWEKFPFNIFDRFFNDDVPTVGFRLTSSETTRRDRLDIKLSGTPLSELSPRLQDILTLVDRILSQDKLHLSEHEMFWTASVDTQRFATLVFETDAGDIQDLLPRGRKGAEKFLTRIRNEKPPRKGVNEEMRAREINMRQGKTRPFIHQGNIFRKIFRTIKNMFGRKV